MIARLGWVDATQAEGAVIAVLYLFALGIGLPILLVYAFGGSLGADFDTGSEGGLFSWMPISAVGFAATLFGLAGLVTVWVGVPALPGTLTAVAVGILAVFLHNGLFGWLRSTEASSGVTNLDLEGATGLVVLGVSAKRRGQIVVEAAGRRFRISALPAKREDRLEKGDRATIVGMDGGVALIARQDRT